MRQSPPSDRQSPAGAGSSVFHASIGSPDYALGGPPPSAALIYENDDDDEVLLASPVMSEAEVEDVLTVAEQMQVSATLDSVIKQIIENQEEIDYYEEALDEDPTDEQARTSIGVLNSVRANLLQEAQQMQADAQAERDAAIAYINARTTGARAPRGPGLARTAIFMSDSLKA